MISPEGCAAILWDDPTKFPDAAAAIENDGARSVESRHRRRVSPEPLGGAHREPKAVNDRVAKALTQPSFPLTEYSVPQLLAQRDQKYRRIGAVSASTRPLAFVSTRSFLRPVLASVTVRITAWGRCEIHCLAAVRLILRKATRP